MLAKLSLFRKMRDGCFARPIMWPDMRITILDYRRRVIRMRIASERLFMKLIKGSLAGLVLAGILAIAPSAAFAHDGWHEGHYGYEHRHEYRGRDWYGGGHRGWYGRRYGYGYPYYGY
jgi:hypothetical protein